MSKSAENESATMFNAKGNGFSCVRTSDANAPGCMIRALPVEVFPGGWLQIDCVDGPGGNVRLTMVLSGFDSVPSRGKVCERGRSASLQALEWAAGHGPRFSRSADRKVLSAWRRLSGQTDTPGESRPSVGKVDYVQRI